MALKVPDGPNPKTIKYSDLLGCDFSQDASLVDRRHSPYMLNMISDEGGSPVKRKGWEVLYEETQSVDLNNQRTFNKVYALPSNTEDIVIVVKEINSSSGPINIHYSHIYYYDEINKSLVFKKAIFAEIYCGFTFKKGDKEGLYLLTEQGIKLIRNDNGVPVVEDVKYYVPTTLLSRQPSGTKAGVPYEEVNLLTKKRTESFLTKTADYDESATTTFKVSNQINTEETVTYKYMNTQGAWVEGTVSSVSGNTVTVSSAAGEPPSAGTDNVLITYTATGTINKAFLRSTQYAFYSQGSMDHIFLTGSIYDQQRVWWSAIGDPTYFPDTNYLELGSDGGKCMGFLPVGNELAVIKSERSNDHSTIYLIYDKSLTSTSVTTTNSDGSSTTKSTQEYSYAIKRIASANGAVSNNGFAVLGDEPLFLSEQGLFGIVSTNTSEDRVIRNRSRFVDKKLLAEPDLKDAKMLVHKDYLYVFINSHVYVFDARHKTGDERNNTNYMYEAYYWENVPLKGFCIANNTLYFVNEEYYDTDNGEEQKIRFCRFKNTGRLDDYSDGSHWDSTEEKQVGGVPIHAIWATRNDDDNAPQMFKTMMKKGTMCTLAPYDRSSVYVYVIADGRKRFEIGRFYADRMGLFEDVDFDRFTFDTSEGPRDYFFRKKRKKYVRLQIFFENNELDEGFGLFHVIKTYTEIRYAK